MVYFLIKRLFDFFFALLLLLLLAPIFIIVVLMLFFSNEGKPFFFQDRPGKKEKIFKIVKFKTMNDKKDVQGNLLPDSKRLTSLGKFIRRTSLDEIPQLINVLKGDMSFVGPRPLLPEYLSLYNEKQKKRHFVSPGITGWAQVNGRNSITWTKKLACDVHYVENMSLLLDLKILYKTVFTVVGSKGINADNHATIEKFNGEN